MTPSALNIDIVSDVICPWCYVGQRRLAKALDLRPDLAVAVAWRPFQLAPEVPKEGMDRRAYLEAKFGKSAGRGAIYEALQQAGRDEGIAFAFDRIDKTPNTLDAHRLIYWAGGAGLQHRVAGLLFSAYFEQGLDIGAHDTLIAIAKAAGMDGDRVASLLEGDVDLERIEHDIAVANNLGITGVPTFMINRRFLVQGAQDAAQLAASLDYAATAA